MSFPSHRDYACCRHVCLSVCLSVLLSRHCIILKLTHLGAALDAASARFGPSVRGPIQLFLLLHFS